MLLFIMSYQSAFNFSFSRSGRLKQRVLKEQETLQRRVALASYTGHDEEDERLPSFKKFWKKIFK